VATLLLLEGLLGIAAGLSALWIIISFPDGIGPDDDPVTWSGRLFTAFVIGQAPASPIYWLAALALAKPVAERSTLDQLALGLASILNLAWAAILLPGLSGADLSSVIFWITWTALLFAIALTCLTKLVTEVANSR
jgi:hypothetical protein